MSSGGRAAREEDAAVDVGDRGEVGPEQPVAQQVWAVLLHRGGVARVRLEQQVVRLRRDEGEGVAQQGRVQVDGEDVDPAAQQRDEHRVARRVDQEKVLGGEVVRTAALELRELVQEALLALPSQPLLLVGVEGDEQVVVQPQPSQVQHEVAAQRVVRRRHEGQHQLPRRACALARQPP